MVKKFNEMKSNYLSQKELDNMTYDELHTYIGEIGKKIIQTNPRVDKIFKRLDIEYVRYFHELEIYNDVKFRENEMRFLYKNFKNVKDFEENGIEDLTGFDLTNYNAEKLVVSLAKKHGIYFLSNMILKDKIKFLDSKYEYVDITIPENFWDNGEKNYNN